MNKSFVVFRFIVFLLATSIFLMGCHSFYEIPKEEYENIDQMDDIKIVYKNGKEKNKKKNQISLFLLNNFKIKS